MAVAKAIEARGRSAVVLNADSAQVYADLEVLSARPNLEEMNGIKHRLFGNWDGAKACSAADWANTAQSEIEKIHADGAVPILCGGTGLYIRTLLDGIAPIPSIEPSVREAVRALDKHDAYAALQQRDPVRAALLNPGDSQRVARALEVIISTDRSLSDWQVFKEGGIGDTIDLAPLVMLPSREQLYERCGTRFAAMLGDGAVEEVEALLARNLPADVPVMRAIGVPEITAMLRGEIDRETCVVRAAQATRNYAKRQYTWFRRQPPAHWPRLEQAPDAEAFVSAMRL